ncbi:MAG: hypothetical protein ACI8P3_000711, partial [Saprospiraceae bacterium]
MNSVKNIYPVRRNEQQEMNIIHRYSDLERVGNLAFGLQTPLFRLYFIPKILIMLWHKSGFWVSSKQKI